MKIAGVQLDISLGQIEQNLASMDQMIAEAASNGAQLVIFPECTLTGYCFDSLDEAREYSQPANGTAARSVVELCQQHQVHSVYGFLESDGDRVFNACSLVGPEGVISTYRKVHLPYLGIDRFTTYGDRPFEVASMPGLNVGMNICYDAAFPEAARCLTLLRADLIALPTNWPPGAECMSPAVICTRAMENKVYYAAINRIGTERGVTFIGRSCICGPNGEILAAAADTEQTILYAEIDVNIPRDKHVIRRKGLHEIDRLADRRPECYHPLTEPHQLTTPRMRLGAKSDT
ncbi:MAG: carbon-nitrogen hydrolase family protein [Planctomycetaceae bacterium]|nr:carbon-nitrogen hydrolase family protein [Planctomycetaceae bacterium]